MESINLSKLVLSNHFLELLTEENIHFDGIFSDNKELSEATEVKRIDRHLESFFSWLDKNSHILLILDKLWIEDIFSYIQWFSSICVLSAHSWLASFSKKFHPEIEHVWELHEKITILFPWDLEDFIKGLQKEGNIFIPLSNQEVPENIYASSSDEESWVQFIDKSLIDKKNILSLLSPEKAEICLIGMGTHFEELVKLSQLLATIEARISLHILNQWDLLFSEEWKELFKEAKRLGIILDQKPHKKLIEHLEKLWKPLEIITPCYEKLTSIMAEYQYEQSDFNAIALYERILELL